MGALSHYLPIDFVGPLKYLHCTPVHGPGAQHHVIPRDAPNMWAPNIKAHESFPLSHLAFKCLLEVATIFFSLYKWKQTRLKSRRAGIPPRPGTPNSVLFHSSDNVLTLMFLFKHQMLTWNLEQSPPWASDAHLSIVRERVRSHWKFPVPSHHQKPLPSFLCFPQTPYVPGLELPGNSQLFLESLWGYFFN